MGLFNKTEEELRIIEEKKQLKELKEALKSNKDLASDQIGLNKLLDYIDEFSEGKKEDFLDTDFLIRSFLKFNKVTDLYEAIFIIKYLLPYGINTPNYESIKEVIINNFLGEYGYLKRKIFDYSLYSLIKDFDNFTRVMNTISKNEKAVENFNKLNEYIIKAAKYSVDEESFVKSIISTIEGLDDSVLNVDTYLESEIEKDKKRAGVYALSHDDIMTASSTMRKIDSQMEKLDNYITIVEEKSKNIINTTNESELKIKQATELSIIELKKYRSTLEKELKHLLEQHLENVKIEINNKADTVFSEILKKYQEQLEEFRIVSKNLSIQSTRELTLLKEETDKSLNELREYVHNNPELKSALTQAEESAAVRDKLLEIIKVEQERPVDTSEEKIVRGINRIVVPNTKKVEIPDSVVTQSNVQIIKPYAFKNAKDFAKVMRNIEKQIALGESKGGIYHKKIKELLACLMVGDWPYMYGPSGAGKGHTVRQVGSLLGQKVIDAGKIGDVPSVVGYIDPQGRFRAPSALEAVVDGCLVFFDEFDNGNPDTRVALNTMYSNLRDKIIDPSSDQYIRFAQEIDVPINPNMRMIAAGNTDGNGSDRQYTDRYPIDESIKERLKYIYFDYDNRVEQHILKDYKDWYEFFINFRNACNEYAKSQGDENAQGNVSTRDASDINRDINLNAKELDDMMNQYFVQSKESDYRNALARQIAKVYNIEYNQEYDDYHGTLSEADGLVLAKQFVTRCNKGIKG